MTYPFDTHKDRAFMRVVLPGQPESVLQGAVDWIRDNLDPDEVFTYQALAEWALIDDRVRCTAPCRATVPRTTKRKLEAMENLATAAPDLLDFCNRGLMQGTAGGVAYRVARESMRIIQEECEKQREVRP